MYDNTKSFWNSLSRINSESDGTFLCQNYHVSVIIACCVGTALCTYIVINHYLHDKNSRLISSSI